jgi:glycosylphosphatidylinositol deacylase
MVSLKPAKLNSNSVKLKFSNKNNNNTNNNNNNNNNNNYNNNQFLPCLSNYIILFISSIIGLIIMLSIGLSFMIPFDGADTPNCKGVYMSPAYAKIHAFDLSHTKFASKYSLYLYREQDKDELPDNSGEFNLSGTPILFIPGNAGSYKQVRSIAAETSNQYYENNEFIKSLNINSNNMDFFTADFNEDFTAFHGRTMLDQSEYLNDAIKFILSLYQSNNSKNIPKSVILLGHSMGGIVARVMLSLPNYLENSVNTIITLSTPHNAAPTTFDGDLLNVYKLTDDFWRNGFKNDNKFDNSKLAQISKERLSNVSIISITGGILDTTLPTDYTTLTGLVPSNHGFSISTTGIPGVWTPIDHLAIVWCDQLRKVLAKTLLQIIDVNSPSQTYPLDKRMEIFKLNLLPGFQKASDIMKNVNINYNLPYKLKIDLKQLKDSTNNRFFELPKKILKRNNIKSPPIHLFNIPKDDHFKFNFLSSLEPSIIENLNFGPSLSVLLCRSIPKYPNNKIDTIDNYKKIYDYTTDFTQKYAEFECLDVHQSVYMIPKSSTSNPETITSNSGVYYALEIPSHVLSSFNSIVLVESNNNISNFNSDDFVLADLELESSSTLKLGDSSLWKLMTRGDDITIPAHRSIIVDIDVPVMRSSLLAYRLDIRYAKSKNEKFSPILSQTIKGETKWHRNLDSSKIITSIITGDSPFTPFIVNDPSGYTKLKFFTDALSSVQLMDIYLSIDWFQSLKLLVLKYRLSIIGFPLFITLVIISLQFIHYSKHNVYPSYGETMLFLCQFKFFGSLLFFFSILSFITSSGSILNRIFELFDPVERNDLALMSKIEHTEVQTNMTFMSIEEPSLWFYGCFILLISLGLNFLLYNLILLLLKIFTYISNYSIWNYFRVPKFQYFSNQRKTVSILALLILVLIYLPYQFAFIVCVLTQIFSTLHVFSISPSLNAYHTQFIYIKESLIDKETLNEKIIDNKDNENINVAKKINLIENFKNFNLSFTILMLWLIPINVPVLIVWIHDISIKWITPFSSHHNILAILPIIIFVQMLNQGYMIPRPKKIVNILISKTLLIYFALYSLLFGTRHLYFLHSLFNLICVWFLILIIQDWGTRSLEKVNLITKNITKLH